MGPITVVTSERRRVWTDQQKQAVMEEAFAPGANVADVARRHEISSGLIYTWRRKTFETALPAFVKAVVPKDRTELGAGMAISVEMPGGRVSISGSASPALVSAVLRAMR